MDTLMIYMHIKIVSSVLLFVFKQNVVLLGATKLDSLHWRLFNKRRFA